MIEILTNIIFLIIGALLTIVVEHYIYPLYFMPHSHLRVLYDNSRITIDNLGKAPVEWAVIKVRVNDVRSLIKSFKVVGSLDVRKPEPYLGGNYFWVVINNITPKDWGAIEIEMDRPSSIQIEVESSCQHEKGGRQTISQAPSHGAWGKEESYEEWLKRHHSNI